MKTITLPSGTYAVDPILDGFDIIEKPSSNVAFVCTDILANKLYVQFKNGSGYMYSEVDCDVMCALPAALSIGSFISKYVVKHFPSEKQEKALIMFVEVIIDDPYSDEEVNEETKQEWLDKQIAGRLNRTGQTGTVTELDLRAFPAPILITGDTKNFPAKSETGMILVMSEGATVEWIEPTNVDEETEF
ncbi:KTSC domain-containing protein [Pedobacter antarcticus]|uniref:KTSC domain-containing protein n=1 Tax=Pedobacter antarcticus TaxID=34086 RepID=UPI00292CD407|nr:KTSC domain-containing protein [Pedobacter antarcticus]